MSLSHVNPESNQPGMVNVGDKAATRRRAVAEGWVVVGASVLTALEGDDWQSPKGPVFQTAIIGGTQAVKRTAELIPFCHPLPLNGIDFTIEPVGGDRVRLTCAVETEGKTGVEMEALTGVSAAALILYDMCKALSQEMEITGIRVIEKTGGKSDILLRTHS